MPIVHDPSTGKFQAGSGSPGNGKRGQYTSPVQRQAHFSAAKTAYEKKLKETGSPAKAKAAGMGAAIRAGSSRAAAGDHVRLLQGKL